LQPNIEYTLNKIKDWSHEKFNLIVEINTYYTETMIYLHLSADVNESKFQQ